MCDVDEFQHKSIGYPHSWMDVLFHGKSHL